MDARHFSMDTTLRNGTPVRIRAARPDDRARIVEAFGKLDRESVYTRFFSYRNELTPAQLARLESADFVRTVLLVATIPAGNDEAVIAGASYAASEGRGGELEAEVAFTVEEDYQGQGLAGKLLAQLIAIARGCGISRLVADVLAGNRAMLAVFARSGLPTAERREDGVVHVTMDLVPPRAEVTP